MNRVIVSGNICQDVVLKYTASNIPAIQNTIAVRNNYKNNDGNYDSQFINFVAWKHNAQFLKKYTQKGQKVLLEGKLISRTYEKDGIKRYVTEINVEKVELIGWKKEDNNESGNNISESTNELPDYLADDEIELGADDLPF